MIRNGVVLPKFQFENTIIQPVGVGEQKQGLGQQWAEIDGTVEFRDEALVGLPGRQPKSIRPGLMPSKPSPVFLQMLKIRPVS